MGRQKRKIRTKSRIIFFVEGETEEAFFNQLAQKYRLTASKTVKIMDNCGNDWIEKAKNMMKNNPKLRPDENTKIFIIFDINNNTQEEIEHMINKGNSFSYKNSSCKIGFSNISFELWLLAHYCVITPSYINSKTLYNKLSSYIGQPYEKANQKQISKILENDKVLDAINNTKDVTEPFLTPQSTNIGDIVRLIIRRN